VKTEPDDPGVWYVHIHQQNIRTNQVEGTDLPVTVILHRGETHVAHSVDLPGPVRVVYNPDAPLNGGTRVWLETRTAPVLLDSPLYGD
jgi:hypothetical protein